MLADLGLTVARQIPLEMIPKIASGAYRVFPGVIRDGGGRIVMHLVGNASVSALTGLVPGVEVISSLVQHAQLWQISRDVEKVHNAVQTVLGVASVGTALSGLGMVTSIAGFVYLSKRLDQVDRKLAIIERDVKGLKDLVVSLQKSKLQFAIDNLRHADAALDPLLRRDLLLQSKRDFSTLTHQYREQWSKCRTSLEIETIDDFYTLAMIGHATVCSNLGIGNEAVKDISSSYKDWLSQARLHSKEMLFSDRPERLLSAEYVGDLPARTLSDLLDFAHGTERGIDWLDELRMGAGKKPNVLDRLPNLPMGARQPGSAKPATAELVSLVKTLRARSEVLDASVAHYDFLNERQLSATDFQRQLEAARVESGEEMICVFQAGDAPRPALVRDHE